MRLARCEKGHYYDKDKFTACPHCNGMQVAPGETVAFEDPAAKKEEVPKVPEAPKVQVEDRVPFSTNAPLEQTMTRNPYSTEELAKNNQAKLFTEEINPMTSVNAENAVSFAEEPKLFTEELDSMNQKEVENQDGNPPLDEMKTIMLDEDQAMVTPNQEVVMEKAEEAVIEPEAESVKEAVIEPEAEQAEEAVVEPEAEQVEEAAVEPEAEKAEEAVIEPEAEKAEEAAVEPEAEQAEEAAVEPEAEKAEEAVIEPEAEQVEEAAVEPEAEQVEEAAVEPEAEQTEETAVELEADENLIEEAAAAQAPKEAAESLQKTVATAVSSRIPDDSMLVEKNSNPVIGWLIGIEGIHRGKSYDVKEGRNFIGRSTAMDICLSGNNKINRERHAIITYDPRSKSCFFQPDESRDLIYINDKLLLGPEMLKHEDVVYMGEEQFIFIQLKSDRIDWV